MTDHQRRSLGYKYLDLQIRHGTFGFPQPFSRYRDGVELPQNQQLALCFSQWMEMSDQPQISSTVLDLCYSIFNSMHKNEDSHGTLGRPFFLFRPRNGRTIEGSEYRGI
ncbi:PREDICTED: neuromedin-S isoform X2 [Corvus brachyrhynchos]|uniref:neuromedin-S isoform X2 n=1 Tax=Corvus brachyrhynchos TaxID=85066 RepID=UPI0008167058|nr:PREDICTED: neuromedin-S isoform X2 [Corvus brachyrhynchos]